MKEIINSIKEDLAYWITMVLLSSLLFYNYTMGSDYLALFCTIGYCVYVLRCREEYVLPSMVYMSLFAYLFSYNEINLIFFISFSFIVRISLLSKSQKPNYIFLLAYLITHLIATSVRHINVFLLSSILSLFTVYFASLAIEKSKTSLLGNSFLLSFFLSSLFGFFKDSTRLAERFDADEAFEMLRYSGLSYDANFYSLIAVVAICIVVHNIKKQGSFLHYIVLAIIILLGMQTLSKSFYLCSAVLVLYSMLVSKNKIKYMLFLGIVIVAVLPFIKDSLIPLLDVMDQRLDRNQDASSFTTGRIDLWKMYSDILFGSVNGLLLGHGAVLPSGMEAAHNTYLELLFKFGIIGTLFDVMLLSSTFSRIRSKIGKISAETFVYIGALALLLFALSSYTFLSLWSCLFMIFVVSVDNSYNKKIQV